ncbi:MAG: hypothetical protein ACOY3P_24860 [Planctomycetota bacterium]
MRCARTFLCCLLGGMLVAAAAIGAEQPSEQPRPIDGRGKRQDGDGGGERRGRGGGRELAVPPELAGRRLLNIVLGRPTDHSIAVSLLSAADIDAQVEYGAEAGRYGAHSEPLACKAGTPAELELKGLQPNTRYYYRLLTRPMGGGPFQPGAEGTFHTQRAPGSTFAFAVQGDSHPEREGRMYDPSLYAQTVQRVAKDIPDFYLTMGDDFSLDRLILQNTFSQEAVNRIYAHQRNFLGVVGQTSALFLVNGNHEHAELCLLDGTENNPAVMAGRARTLFYPLPAPDAFYTGNTEEVKFVGLPRDYYAWQWGDALFVVIDLYWHSPLPVDHEPGTGRARPDDRRGGRQGEQKRGGGKGGGKGGQGGGGKDGEGGGERNPGGRREPWGATLGEAQYRWLTRTLSESKARWKFVFCHHVLGTGRGGIELADQFEWGGKDRDGQYVFPQKRPGWPLPIHQLMAENGVTIFFQGHDHIFCRQQLDGVVYQSCPNPADATYQAFNREAYRSGDILPNSGHLRITVAPQKVGVDYIRSYLPKDATKEHPDGELAFHYDILAP